MESIGILTPKCINETLINEEIIIAGVCLTIKETIIPKYFTTKMIDHPLHIGNEFPSEVILMIPENLVTKFIGGHYHCISGKFMNYYNLIEDKLENAKEFKNKTSMSSYVIGVKGID